MLVSIFVTLDIANNCLVGNFESSHILLDLDQETLKARKNLLGFDKARQT